LILFLPSLLTRYPVRAAETPNTPESLVVDFTNDESRSISLRFGSGDGIMTEMNFAVIDSTGERIAEFYPHEIFTDRFWSGPLARDSFARIRTGDPVIRIDLVEVEAAALRRQFKERIEFLEEERRLEKLRRLGEKGSELADRINELDVALFHLNGDRVSLLEKLSREEGLVRKRVNGLQKRIVDLREERFELAQDRKVFIERRYELSKRADPPPDSMERLNIEIRELDREIKSLNIRIGDLRQEIRQSRDGTRKTREEVSRNLEERRVLDADRLRLNRELDTVLGEMDTLNSEVYP
jgi:hypothetical protein